MAALAAEPGVVCRSRSSSISVLADDPDGDSLRYTWETTGGVIIGEGSTVSWDAPDAVVDHIVSVTVEDGEGGSASASVEVESRDGSLILTTETGLIEVGLDGTTRLITGARYPNVETFGERIFVLAMGYVVEYDRDGNRLGETRLSYQGDDCTDFLALPGGRFACLNNVTDMIAFVDATGAILHSFQLPSNPGRMQSTDGMVVGDQVFVCCTDGYQMVQLDLNDFNSPARFWNPVPVINEVGIGHLDYSQGVFYLAKQTEVFRYLLGAEGTRLFSTAPEGNVTGLVTTGSYLFFTLNHSGRVYRANPTTGSRVSLLENLAYPADAECLPAYSPKG